MVQEALGAFGRLDWACNSASVSESVKLLTDLTEAEWDDFVGVSLKGVWRLSDRVELDLGYRLLEGGADNDEVYTFAFFHYAVAGVRVRF
jgi:NAD(P)-dependent dehydrogenase (short-subunit alcohol dehydrogenase family)